MVLIFLNKKLQQRDNTKYAVNLFIRLFSLIIALAELTNGFNVAPEAHYVARFNSESHPRSSYFGYSVGLLKTANKTWLLVGAPRANSTIHQIIEPGTLFKCDVSNKAETCEEVVLDNTMNNYIDQKFSTRPLRNHAWTGAALDIDRDGNVAIGAPRWSDIPAGRNEYNTNGLCYTLGRNLTSEKADKLPVLLLKGKQLYRTDHGYVYFYQHGEVGMSAHFTNTQQLLLGAPGVLNWQGSVAQLEPSSTSPSGDNKSSKIFDPRSATVLNPINSAKIQDSNYFGYSVTSGKFDFERDYYIVAGAPRGASSYGMAIVFLMRGFGAGQRFFIKEEKSGSQLGEYFGASVAAPDLNGDSLSDLVVGAPLHSHQGVKDAGCVSVYMNSAAEKGTLLALNAIKLFGHLIKGARFGSALGTPGDLNNDGFEDLLVGAPYENDEGAVYVFMGVRNGVRETFSQKLTPKSASVKVPLKGFGISFSRPVDVDDNKYPDFAIGSYLSNVAIVMRTRPVIAVQGTISANPSKLSIADSQFTTTPCLSFSGYGAPASADIIVSVTISQESGDGSISATFKKNGNPDIQVHMRVFSGKNSTCEELGVNLIRDGTKTLLPLSVHLKYDLPLEDHTGPVIDPHATFPAPITLSFITGCKNDPECYADLVINAHFKDFTDGDHLLIGNTSKITLEIVVTNLKDLAFLPNVSISYPSALKRFPSEHICSSQQRKNRLTFLVCLLKSPLSSNDGEKLILEFDVSALDDSSPDIVIDLLANSAADKEENPADNNFKIQLKVKKKAKLEFVGSSNPEQYSYHHFDEQTIIANESVKIQSNIVISKLDVTPLGEVNITVKFPSEFDMDGNRMALLQNFDNKLLFHGKTYYCEEKENNLDFTDNSEHIPDSQSENRRYSAFGSKLFQLSCSSNLFHCKSVICRIGPWSNSFDVATLTVSYELNLTTLSYLIHVKKGAVIENEVFAEISSLKGHEEQFEGIRKIVGRISMTLIAGTLPPEPLAWWIYLIAILGGFLLLALIAIGLFKVGFFKRKKKLQLEAQKATLLHEDQARQEED